MKVKFFTGKTQGEPAMVPEWKGPSPVNRRHSVRNPVRIEGVSSLPRQRPRESEFWSWDRPAVPSRCTPSCWAGSGPPAGPRERRCTCRRSRPPRTRLCIASPRVCDLKDSAAFYLSKCMSYIVQLLYCPAVFDPFSPAPVKTDRAVRIQ